MAKKKKGGGGGGGNMIDPRFLPLCTAREEYSLVPSEEVMPFRPVSPPAFIDHWSVEVQYHPYIFHHCLRSPSPAYESLP